MSIKLPSKEALEKLDAERAKLRIFANLAKPPMNTTQRLIYSSMCFLKNYLHNDEDFRNADICSREMAVKIQTLRFDTPL